MRMNWDSTNSSGVRRASLILCLSLALILVPALASAYTPVHFLSLQSQINADIATLSALTNPTREQRNLLRCLNRANEVLARTSVSDGKTLRALNSILVREAYVQPLTSVASNLLLSFTSEHAFVGSLLVEMPPSPEATAVALRYSALASLVEKLNAAPNIAKFSALYDAMKSRLDTVFAEVNEALIVPFPADITEDSVKARINGVAFSASSGSSSENSFKVTVTETNIAVTLGAVDSTRGLFLSVPNAKPGTFRYTIPQSAAFTNRTGINFFNPGQEMQAAATEGTVFVSTTATEVYGIFSCSGPGFNVIFGRFRISISSQP